MYCILESSLLIYANILITVVYILVFYEIYSFDNPLTVQSFN
jgi:hypothetical protein